MWAIKIMAMWEFTLLSVTKGDKACIVVGLDAEKMYYRKIFYLQSQHW